VESEDGKIDFVIALSLGLRLTMLVEGPNDITTGGRQEQAAATHR
jgi:hypothetical protein